MRSLFYYIQDQYISLSRATIPLRRYCFFKQLANQNVIFVHIPKTAGTSITRALGFPPPNPHLGIEKHTSLDQIAKLLEKAQFPRYKVLTTVRHPMDRMISHYNFRKRNMLMSPRFEHSGFEEWASKILKRRDMKHMRPQCDWLKIDGDYHAPDVLLRFETLQHDFERLVTSWGVRTSLPHLLDSTDPSNQISDHISEKIRLLVNDRYAEDFERFNYRKV